MANGKRRTRNRRCNSVKGSHGFQGRRGGGKPSHLVNKAKSRGGSAA